jgi:adenylate kinase family enzyme
MQPDTAKLAGSARRVFVVGPSGSGKSTLAARMGAALNVPVHDLDQVFRDGGGNGSARPKDAVAADIAQVAASAEWVAEGIHLEGTQPLFESADLIVWLDDGSWARSSGRIVRRFFGSAWSTARSQRNVRDFFRFRDYWRHVRELAGAVPAAHRYETQVSNGKTGQPTRQDVGKALAPYESKVVRCSSTEETTLLVNRLRPAAARHG